MERIVGLLVVISLLVFGVYFLQSGKLGSKTFVAYVSVVLIVGIAFHLSDRLRELDIKNLRLVLGELKETRRDIEREVSMLLETLGENYIYSATDTGRFTDADLNKHMVVKRNRAIELLTRAGWSADKVEEKVEKINFLIASDYMNDILDSSWQYLLKTKPESAQSISKPLHEGFRALKGGRVTEDTLKQMQEFLSEYDVPETVYKDQLAKLRYFIKYKELQ